MPDNFPILLSVEDLSNLLAFLSSLTGATTTEETTTDDVGEVISK